MIKNILDRKVNIFDEAMLDHEKNIKEKYKNSKILIIGGAGSIGRAVVLELCKYNPKSIHIVDISENNLVELIRLIRSGSHEIDFELKTFVIDIVSDQFLKFIDTYSYDNIFNLAAMKHVRSERDFFSLSRMISVK